MHEVSIIYDALKEIECQCDINNIRKVKEITMAVGEFTTIEPSALIFAFESLSKGTISEGAKLKIINLEGKSLCEKCNKEFHITFTNKICPTCGFVSNNITGGYEILLYKLEGE